jgi:hypothetical protein
MKRAALVVVMCAVPLFAATRVWAANPPTVVNAASLSGSVLAAGRGVAAVNEAAGQGNVQANSDAIANGGQARARVHQRLTGTAAGAAADSASLRGEAFARFSGILNVNQAAGSDNLEANTVTVGRSLHRLSLDQLTRIAPPVKQINHAPLSASAGGRRTVTVADNALKGVTGIAQVSQAAGSENSLSNSVTLNISAGMRP